MRAAGFQTTLCHFPNLRVGRMNAQFAQIYRHTDAVIKILHRRDAAQGDFFIASVLGNAHNVARKFHKARQTIPIHMPRPVGPDCRKSRAVGYIEHAPQFMFQLMRHKISAVIAAAGQIIVRKAARPHDLGARIIVLRILMQNLRVSNAANLLINAGIVDEANVVYTNINSSGATVTDVSYVRSLVVDYLTAHPEDKKILIIAQTDDQGTAANSAVLSSNRTDEVAIVSINCDTAVVAMLQEKTGSIIGTFNANPQGYGPQVIEACARILAAEKAGEEVGPKFDNQGVVVSRENVWDFFPEKVEG